MENHYTLHPIGQVKVAENGLYTLHIISDYRPALRELGRFSHVLVFWWFSAHDNAADRATLQADLPYAPGVRAGVFACRSERRPNPLALTLCAVLEVDENAGTVTVPWMDAFDGSPILDLKPYLPMSDRVRDVRVAEWFAGFPANQEEAADFDFGAAGLA